MMLRLFIAQSVETNFGSLLNINHTFLYSFLCSHWFGCITNWPHEELQLDANTKLRSAHMSLMGFVTIEAILGITCPLTIL